MLQSHELTPGLITCFPVSCCLCSASHFSLSTVGWHPAEEDILNEKLTLSWSATHPRRHSTNWTAISSGVDCDGTGAAGLRLHEEAVRCMAWSAHWVNWKTTPQDFWLPLSDTKCTLDVVFTCCTVCPPAVPYDPRGFMFFLTVRTISWTLNCKLNTYIFFFFFRQL